jgi:hypothetical protein
VENLRGIVGVYMSFNAEDKRLTWFLLDYLGEMSKQFSDADDLQSELAQVTLILWQMLNAEASWSLYLVPVLENVRQRQQHRCQEIFNKISSQENLLALCRKFLLSYIQECHTIYLLFENSKVSILQVEMCGIRVHTFSEIYIL